jgi:hypothetical protein
MVATASPTQLPTEGGGQYEDNFGTALGDSSRNPLLSFVRFVIALRHRQLFGETPSETGAYSDTEDGTAFSFYREDGKSQVFDGLRALMVRVEHRGNTPKPMLMFINCWTSPVCFFVPAPSGTGHFRRVVDSAVWAEPFDNHWPIERAEIITDPYWVQPQSIVVLVQA